VRDPERQLLDAIAVGELDEHLVAIADAIHARRELLHIVRSAAAIAQLCVGDTVMLNRKVRPRYLAHELAMITELDEHWVTLRLARPVGRFRDAELRCLPLAVRKLERTGSQPPHRRLAVETTSAYVRVAIGAPGGLAPQGLRIGEAIMRSGLAFQDRCIRLVAEALAPPSTESGRPGGASRSVTRGRPAPAAGRDPLGVATTPGSPQPASRATASV
jgi:hypothetical protein